MKIKIGDKEFIATIAKDSEEKRIGLSNTTNLNAKEAFVMKFDPAEDVSITMKDMHYPLDLIFIREGKLLKKVAASPGEDSITIGDLSDTVVEIKAGEALGLRKGNSIEYIGEKLEDGTVEMAEGGLAVEGNRQLLDEKGKNQMNLLGGERIFSRISTKRMFELAKQKKYKTLGKYLYNEIKAQDKRPVQYADN